MQLPLSQTLAAELIWCDEASSTNDVLRELVQQNQELADRTVVVTDSQTAGRGRLGREWVAPAGHTLAVSVLVRDFTPELGAGWLPLIAGSAVRRGLSRVLSDLGVATASLGVKWPNDVLAHTAEFSGYKLSGILSEMLADGSVIVGIGINTTLTSSQLPTPTSTSLAVLAGESTVVELDAVLSAVLEELFTLLDLSMTGQFDAIRQTVTVDSSTLGTQVRALLPGGGVIDGTALRLTDDGALVIATRGEAGAEPAALADVGSGSEPAEVVVAAGDIEHLR